MGSMTLYREGWYISAWMKISGLFLFKGKNKPLWALCWRFCKLERFTSRARFALGRKETKYCAFDCILKGMVWFVSNWKENDEAFTVKTVVPCVLWKLLFDKIFNLLKIWALKKLLQPCMAQWVGLSTLKEKKNTHICFNFHLKSIS